MSIENNLIKVKNKTSNKEIIQSESIEEHERLLDEKMLNIQFDFINKLRNKEISLPENSLIDLNNQEDCFEKLTDLMKIISTKFSQRTHTPDNNDNPEYLKYKKEIFEKIKDVAFDDSKKYYNDVMGVIDSCTEKLPISINDKNNERDFKKNIAGVINFSSEEFKFSQYKLPEEVLKKYDISEYDDCMGIHLGELFKQKKDEKIENIFSSESFKKLAEKIVKEYPQTRMILARSWLMNTVIAKRAGFNVCHNNDDLLGPGFWGQFIDQNGNIYQDRVDFLMKNGKPPFPVSEAYIPVEDFLKKYLPEEEKKNVVLKKMSKDFVPVARIDKEKFEERTKKEELLGKNWNIFSAQEIFDFLNENDDFFREFFKTSNGEILRNFIIESKIKNESVKEFQNSLRGTPIEKVIIEFRREYESKNKPVENIKKYTEYTPDLS